MWDRFRPRDGTIPTLDRKKLEAWQNAHSSSSASASASTPRGVRGGNGQYQYAVRGGPRPKRPPIDVDYLPESAQSQGANYMTAPPMQTAPAGRPYQRESLYPRPASSIYSQPSPEAAVFAAQQLSHEVAYPHADPLEISPPSSPDIASPRDRPYPGDVSPIDEPIETSLFTQERYTTPEKTEPRSNIPMMRRERRKNSDAAMNALRESKSRERTTPPRPYGHDVRWDPRTGEPTTSAKGRPSQINPQEYVHGLTDRAAPAPPSTQERQNPLNNPAALRDRLRQVRQTGTNSQPEAAPRPEWRGASGRTTIVPPVKDNKHVAPLKIPPRSERRGNRNPSMLSPIESNESSSVSSPRQAMARGPLSPPDQGGGGTVSPRSVDPGRQSQSPDIGSNAQQSRFASSYPTPPPAPEDVARLNRPPGQESTTANYSQPPPSHMSTNDKAIRRKPARVPSGQQPERSAPSKQIHHDAVRPHVPADGPSEWRPRVDESTPPVPTPISKPAPEVSVLDRGRPVLAGYENPPKLTPSEPVKIQLESPLYNFTSGTAPKPIPPALRALTRPVPEGNHSTLSVASVLSLDKTLPLPPPEASAKDRVTELNAQLETLGNRRININTAIRKMTEMMPTDNILASEAVVRKREEEKRKVDALRTELADVERQSYELGLKLHRAYKRLDRDAEYEPTTLWVRRVTG